MSKKKRRTFHLCLFCYKYKHNGALKNVPQWKYLTWRTFSVLSGPRESACTIHWAGWISKHARIVEINIQKIYIFKHAIITPHCKTSITALFWKVTTAAVFFLQCYYILLFLHLAISCLVLFAYFCCTKNRCFRVMISIVHVMHACAYACP